jgi:hypothetical protein
MNLPFFLWDGKASFFWGNWQEVEELVDFESIHKDYKIIISLNY